MTEYREGQRVRVEYEGEITSVSPDGANLQLRVDDVYRRYLDLTKAGVKVTVLDPEDWPPQPGDLWEITFGALKGYEFFIRRNSAGALIVTPQDAGGAWDLDMLRAYDPILVRRRNAHPAKPVGVE